MVTWKIKLDDSAKKDLKKLDSQAQKLIIKYLYNKILKLPYPAQLGAALRGRKKGLWRYRVNKYRIICRIQNDILTILVLKVAKRDVVYDD